MSKRKKKHRKAKIKNTSFNQVPGHVVYVGNKENLATSLEIIDYTKESHQVKHTNQVKDVFQYKDSENVTWVNVNGLNATTEIEQLGKYYGLHPLILEDIVNTQQRPKIDEYDKYIFIVLKMLYYTEDGELVKEHISMVLGNKYILTFQEADGDVFDALRDRIKNSKGRIRNSGADYLAYAILDAIIDNYFVIIETMGDKIESLEDSLFLENPDENITQDIQELKREIIRIRRAIYPLREVINRLEKGEHPLIHEKTNHYLRDLYDHIIQVSENIEVYREMTWGLMDMYMTTISNKMNEVMKVLTIMASIFIPLTFIAGVYGMNFDYMPELHFKYAYFYVWGVMLILFVMMLWYFKRKKWL
ncbi:magnesium/cobalt transporter CorA [Mesonia sp. MT50]|uniref:Magnesium transport protein CorA n=1 Tax=Mesonia profundi TaxID=3070998 RepID=A0ABU1A3U7_9FLAO|nr:magnesium/cobalt transporter CorA [Mesonia profundi]MDQ7918310.1 magnesium/cobalt transporter CorA [Mesonia profundi]